MELNSIPQEEYYKDSVQSNLRDIFEPNSYIVSKPQTNGFADIKARISEIIQNIITPTEMDFDSALNERFLDLDFGSEFNIDATKIGVNDAIFFVNLLNQQGSVSYNVEGDKLNICDINNKTINATTSLLNMLKTSFDSKKPIRLDFDRDITVILKLDKEGKIQAHFIPGTSEVEAYLKNNLSCLKQAFDDEEINYSYLGYSKHKNKDQNEEKNNKKRSNQ